MLFGADHAFTVSAEKGWVLDNQSAVREGLHMVFYPKGGTWSNSPVIIYGRSVPVSRFNSVKSLVQYTVNDFHKNGSPRYTSERKPAINTSNGRTAELYVFSGDQWGNHEAAVYFKERGTINYLVFNSRSKANFDKYFADFQKIAKSYHNLYSTAAVVSAERLHELEQEADSLLKQAGAAEYEGVAVQSTGQTMTNAISACLAYFPQKDIPTFSYFVRIDRTGIIRETFLSSTGNGLGVCFSGFMANVHYPPHTFDSFLLHINMKFEP